MPARASRSRPQAPPALRTVAGVLLGLLAVVAPRCTCADWPAAIAEDWVLAERTAAVAAPGAPVTVEDDAAGGCDGIRESSSGFLTADSREPWWQVDLGRPETIELVVLWREPQPDEAAPRYHIRVSNDGVEWRTAMRRGGPMHFLRRDPVTLRLRFPPVAARFVRVQLPGLSHLRLDEVEVYGPDNPIRNLALRRPARQNALSRSSRSHSAPVNLDWSRSTSRSQDMIRRLETEHSSHATRASPDPSGNALARHLEANWLPGEFEPPTSDFLRDRARQRRLALANPLLDFDALLYAKRLPAGYNHMSDQYYGWWSRPGGGLYLLHDFRSDSPREECLTDSFPQPGSFLRPSLSRDARRVLFAWCHYHPDLATHSNKLDKANVPEDAFYQLFELNLDGSGVRQLTRGKYDSFDGRYLPDGRIVFVSTRRGRGLQIGPATAARSLERPDEPDCFVRCGGGPERPTPVYTLHTMNADGSDLRAISPFEMYEWNPEIGTDGAVLYSRWDYVDRDNLPFMGLWTINPDGTNARLVFKNYSPSPHCVFEAKPVPGSRRLIFTASAHHAQTLGSLVLLDPEAGTEGDGPMQRLTPEVGFPETEGWPIAAYANPWPLSERFHLVAWGRWYHVKEPPRTALYLYDAKLRTREILWSHPHFACTDPIPVRTRERPPILASTLPVTSPAEGSFLLADVTRGLARTRPGEIRALRLVAVPAKTQPTMNVPNVGVTGDDPGKCVLGTVPVEADGSAYFRAPAGVALFFQALDSRGIAVQTMRSATHVQPGQTLACIGCHEGRHLAPPAATALAARRPPSRITPGPAGSWPLRFDRLVGPVLEKRCVTCHRPGGDSAAFAKVDLSRTNAWDLLVGCGQITLRDQVRAAYRRGSSLEGDGIAEHSALRRYLEDAPGHHEVRLDDSDRDRLHTWMDTYAQRLGSFSEAQERELLEFRDRCADLLESPVPAAATAPTTRVRAGLTAAP